MTVVGVAGLAGVAFTLTGMILWWRTRRKFVFRLLPRSMKPGPIVHHHRDLGAVAAPLLLLSSATGALMVFESIERAFFGPRLEAREVTASAPPALRPLTSALYQAKARFPDAAIRRVSIPSEAGKPITVRLRQPFEWAPNGRTQLSFDAQSGALLSVQDPAEASTRASLQEKIYPLHSANVGGLPFKIAMTFAGLAMTVLGGFATYSFWFRKVSKRRRRRSGPGVASIQPATAN
jgi:uncharacterized iron-regulated membrane protein